MISPLTNEDNFYHFFLDENKDRDQFILDTLKNLNLPLLIYGAGDLAQAVFEYMQLHHITVAASFVDNKYHTMNSFMGLPCLSIDDALRKNSRCNVLIGTSNYKEGMYHIRTFKNVESVFAFANPYVTTKRQMTRAFLMDNFNEFKISYDLFNESFSKKLFVAYIRSQIYRDAEELFPFGWRSNESPPELDAYFNNDIIQLSTDESYFCGGAYRGEDVKRFVSTTGGKYKNIYAVEPDIVNFNAMVENCKNILNFESHQTALWSSCRTLYFKNKGQQSSFVGDCFDLKNSDVESITIKADTIDNIVRGRPLSLLKLNIRASEYKALEGAVETIRKNHPRLIIYLSIANDSLFSIPRLINSIDSSYQFYLRCDYPMFCRVYLYAIRGGGG